LAHHVDRGIDGHGRERRITGPRCDIDRSIEVDALERKNVRSAAPVSIGASESIISAAPSERLFSRRRW
jgi:hypothetical protein